MLSNFPECRDGCPVASGFRMFQVPQACLGKILEHILLQLGPRYELLESTAITIIRISRHLFSACYPYVAARGCISTVLTL